MNNSNFKRSDCYPYSSNNSERNKSRYDSTSSSSSPHNNNNNNIKIKSNYKYHNHNDRYKRSYSQYQPSLTYDDLKHRLEKEQSLNLELSKDIYRLQSKYDEKIELLANNQSEMKQIDLQSKYQKEKLDKLIVEYDAEVEKTIKVETQLLEKDNELQGVLNELKELKKINSTVNNYENSIAEWEQKYLKEVEINKNLKKLLSENNNKNKELTQTVCNFNNGFNSITSKLKQIEEDIIRNTSSPIKSSDVNKSSSSSSLNLTEQDELERAELKIELLSTQLNDLKKNYETKITTLETELDIVNSKFKNASQEIVKAQINISQLNEQVNQLNPHLNEQLKKVKNESDYNKKLVLELGLILQIINDCDIGSNLDKHDLNLETKLNERISLIKDRNEYIKKAKEISFQCYGNLMDKFYNLISGLNLTRKERDELIARTKKLETKTASREIEKLNVQLKQELDTIKRLEIEIESLKEIIRSSEEKNECNEDNLDKLNKLIINLDIKLKHLMTNYELDYKNDLIYCLNTLEEFIQKMIGKNNNLNEQLSCQRSDYALIVKNFKQKEANFLDEIKNLKELNSIFSIDIEEKNYEIKKLKSSQATASDQQDQVSIKKRKNFSN